MPEQEKKTAEPARKVSFTELFKYASVQDKILIAFGTVFAMGNGAMLPILTIVFGT